MSRIYVVTHKTNITGSLERRLVRAPNPAQAVKHVIKESVSATVASQDDLISLIGKVPVESVVDEPQAELEV